jgi:hypothetical protein
VSPSAEPLGESGAPLPRWIRATAAIASAAVLAYGVLLLDWPVLSIMLLFWLENVLIGGFNVLKMLSTGVRRGRLMLAAAVGTSVFFTVHYGLFTLVHGIFVVTLFSSLRDGGPYAEFFAVLREVSQPGFFIAFAVLAAMQLIEFVDWRRKPPPATPADLMAAPYGRIIILHVTIILGGFLILQLGTPVAGVLLLVALKLLADLLQIAGVNPRTRSKQQFVVLRHGPRA